jgi:hypothetical protein
VPAPEADLPLEYCGDPTAMMPKRRRTARKTGPTASPPNAD